MLRKLETYKLLVLSETASLARILDPRFENNLLVDDEILRRHVSLRKERDDFVDNRCASSMGTDTVGELEEVNLIEECLAIESRQGVVSYDDIHLFLQLTSISDRHVDVLQWWRDNNYLCLEMLLARRDML